jgi:hypothetical protein
MSRYSHTGTKGEKRYSSYSFLTSAIDGVSSQLHAPDDFTTSTHVQETGWASELVWTQRLEEKSFVSAGDRIPIAR